MKSKVSAGLALALALAASAPAFAEDSLKGVIIRRSGDTMVVRNETGETTVKLTDTTKIRATSGSLNARRSEAPRSNLMRGLFVDVSGVQEGDQLVASGVTFKSSDLKAARTAGAALITTDEQVAKNAQGIAENSGRIDNFGLLEAAGRAKVYFPVGSSKLSEQGKKDLLALAAQTKDIKGAYRIAVVGRADPTGNAAANQRLSEARAAAVTSFLITSAGVSPGNLLPQAAVGATPVVQDPDPPKDNADARRVTVTIAVSKSNRTAAAQ